MNGLHFLHGKTEQALMFGIFLAKMKTKLRSAAALLAKTVFEKNAQVGLRIVACPNVGFTELSSATPHHNVDEIDGGGIANFTPRPTGVLLTEEAQNRV